MIKCKDCKYYSDQIGSHNEWTKEHNDSIKPKVLMCAINTPNPSLAALEAVDGRLSSAEHNCVDFNNETI